MGVLGAGELKGRDVDKRSGDRGYIPELCCASAGV